MGRSKRVSLGDARRINELANELHEVSAVPTVRQAHLLNGACRLFSARVSFLAIMRVTPPEGVRFLGHEMGGWLDESAKKFLHRYADIDFVQDPMMSAIVDQPHVAKTFVRRYVMRDRVWYRSEHYNQVATLMGIDERMYAVCPFDEKSGVVGIGMHRAIGTPRFGERDRNLAELLYAPLASLARYSMPRNPSGPLGSLTPRVRQTLELLLQGASESRWPARCSLVATRCMIM